MREQTRVLVTDTTMRDAPPVAARHPHAHLSTSSPCAEAYARGLPQLLSLECWGGATFDVAMRFLTEDPWERLARSASACRTCSCRCCCAAPTASATPTIPTMSSASSCTQAAEAGIDLFRVFDCLNWVENMRVAMDAVREAGKLCEGAICYTGDILDPDRAKYDLKYYVGLAQGAGGGRRAHPRHQGHGRPAEARRRARC